MFSISVIEEDASLSKKPHSSPKLTTNLPEEEKQDRQESNQTEKGSDARDSQEPQVKDSQHVVPGKKSRRQEIKTFPIKGSTRP